MPHLSIRKYQVDPDHVQDVLSQVESGFVPILKSMDGFIAYHVIDGGEGVLASTTVFDTEEQVVESDERAYDWAQESIAQYLQGPARVTDGKVVLEAMG